MFRRISITALLFLETTACAHSNTVIDVQDILLVCHTSNDGHGCKKWNNETVTVKGFLDNGGYYRKPILAPSARVIDKFDNDALGNVFAIEMLVSEVSRKKFDTFLGQEVLITGRLHTECVTRAIEMDKKNHYIPNANDEITITILTGTCHYVTNPYMVDVTIKQAISPSKTTDK